MSNWAYRRSPSNVTDPTPSGSTAVWPGASSSRAGWPSVSCSWVSLDTSRVNTDCGTPVFAPRPSCPGAAANAVSTRRGRRASGKTDTHPRPGSRTPVGTRVPASPSWRGEASGTLTTTVEVYWASVTRAVTGPRKATAPVPSRTEITGAYPLPTRYAFAPSTTSGWLTSICSVRGAASGASRTVTRAVNPRGWPSCPASFSSKRTARPSRVNENGGRSPGCTRVPAVKLLYIGSVFENVVPSTTSTCPPYPVNRPAPTDVSSPSRARWKARLPVSPR